MPSRTATPRRPTPGATSRSVPPEDDVRLVGDVLLDAADHLREVFSSACATEGLSMPEGRLLRFLVRGARQSDLADLLACAPSRVTALLQGLEGAGLVRRRRSRSDRRQNDVVVTDAGLAAIVGVHERLDETSPLAVDLSDADRATLLGLLARLTAPGRTTHDRVVHQ